jgi:hypothetical protein
MRQTGPKSFKGAQPLTPHIYAKTVQTLGRSEGAHHSVATLLDAIAEPQPNVLKQLSMMLPSSST